MPRGVRKTITREALESDIMRTDADLQHCQKRLSELKLRRKRLGEQRDALIYSNIVAELGKAGRSPEELLSQLTQR